MKTEKTPCTMLLELVEQRIEQMDAFSHQDEHDLDVLMHCREKLKLATNSGGTEDDEAALDAVSSDILAIGHKDLVQAAFAPNFDVV